MGTPDFAVPSAAALAEVAQVTAVISQPDQPSGRGLKRQATPVKAWAKQHAIPIYQPISLRDPELLRVLLSLEPDVIVVVAYGKILPRAILQMPRHGCINVHASLLPRWRGAAPIQWALYHGDTVTGVTLMKMDEGMDTGPMLSQREISVKDDETAGELAQRLAELAATILIEDLPSYFSGELIAVPQNSDESTVAPLIRKQDGVVNWSRSAVEIHNQIRAMHPWPCAHTYWQGKRVKLHRSHVALRKTEKRTPGQLIKADAQGIEVACGMGVVGLDELQMEGRARLGASAFMAGHRWQPEQVLKEEAE
ncbi:MAG: methionyl-tRNA formyltransferase [Myxococcales bacterium]|nr:methionyl-tRNA formyltransferase [Myxococcales bacterium]